MLPGPFDRDLHWCCPCWNLHSVHGFLYDRSCVSSSSVGNFSEKIWFWRLFFSLRLLLSSADGFEHYRCDHNASLGLNLANLNKILKCASNDDVLTLKVGYLPSRHQLTLLRLMMLLRPTLSPSPSRTTRRPALPSSSSSSSTLRTRSSVSPHVEMFCRVLGYAPFSQFFPPKLFSPSLPLFCTLFTLLSILRTFFMSSSSWSVFLLSPVFLEMMWSMNPVVLYISHSSSPFKFSWLPPFPSFQTLMHFAIIGFCCFILIPLARHPRPAIPEQGDLQRHPHSEHLPRSCRPRWEGSLFGFVCLLGGGVLLV
mgnify:CR=1 FL=1